MVSEAKKTLRGNILKIRDSLSQEEISSRSRAIEERLFDDVHFKDAHTVAFYIPKGNEVDTRGMMERALKQGKDILVPVANSEITMCRFTSFDELVPGKFGVPEPRERTAEGHTAEVVLVPGIVFGLCMHRIGYGKGYYDNYFKNSKSYRIGICYDFQVMDELPKHEHDIPMNKIITDKRLIKPTR